MRNLARWASLFVVLSFLSFATYAREAEPIIDHIDVPVVVSGTKPVSADRIREAIVTAATWNRTSMWDVTKNPTQDLLSATLTVRNKHAVTVLIPYSTEKFSIKYQNSVNMKYGMSETGVPVIHPFYNKWVQSLLLSIQAELKKL